MDETYRHCSKGNDQAQKASVSLYLFFPIFAFYSPSATHSGEYSRRKDTRRVYKKEVEERRKSKIVIVGVLSLFPPVTGESRLLGVPQGQ